MDIDDHVDTHEMLIALEELRTVMVSKIDEAIKIKDDIESLAEIITDIDPNFEPETDTAAIRCLRELYSGIFTM